MVLLAPWLARLLPRGDSVSVKCNSDNYHQLLVPPDSDNDLGCEGERLPGRVLVGIRGGGVGAVDGVTITPFTPKVASSA